MASRFLNTIRARRPARPVGPPRALLYIGQQCGLCQEADALVRQFELSGRLCVSRVDIASSDDLFKRYCLSIPVLKIEGQPQLAWPFDRAAVTRALSSNVEVPSSE